MKIPAAAPAARMVASVLMPTLRLRVHDPHGVSDATQRDFPVLYAFWHGQMLPLLYQHRNQGAVVIVSEHGDGEIVAGILNRYGYGLARGSTTRGGSRALRQALRTVGAERRDLAITPDGPRGPRHEVTPGVITAARLGSLPVVPIGVGCTRAWRLNSWDVFEVPKPFSEVHLVYGRPIPPPTRDSNELEEMTRLQGALERVSDRARAESGVLLGEPATSGEHRG